MSYVHQELSILQHSRQRQSTEFGFTFWRRGERRCATAMSALNSNRGFRFAIDRGGTFTDVYAELPSGRTVTLKLLSVDPSNYNDAPTEGMMQCTCTAGA